MSVGIIIALIIIGILLLLVEFLVIPGITIAGIVGTLLIVGGVVAGYYFQESKIANLITIATVLVIIMFFIIAFKTETWRKMGLKATIDSHSGTDVAEIFHVGDEGEAVSRLAPIGKILIKDQLVEARSLGGFVDPGTKVKIIRTEKNKLYVEPIKSS